MTDFQVEFSDCKQTVYDVQILSMKVKNTFDFNEHFFFIIYSFYMLTVHQKRQTVAVPLTFSHKQGPYLFAWLLKSWRLKL